MTKLFVRWGNKENVEKYHKVQQIPKDTNLPGKAVELTSFIPRWVLVFYVNFCYGLSVFGPLFEMWFTFELTEF